MWDGILEAAAGRRDWEAHLGEHLQSRSERKLRSGACHGLGKGSQERGVEETTEQSLRHGGRIRAQQGDQKKAPKQGRRKLLRKRPGRQVWEAGLGERLGRVRQVCPQSMPKKHAH